MFKIIDGPENSKVPIKAWTSKVQVEPQAIEQLKNLSQMPFIFKHLAVMPDVHWGMGATVGSVIATKGAIIPAAVGVDIGCGMSAQKVGLKIDDLPSNLFLLRSYLEEAIPHGRSHNGGKNDKGAFRDNDVSKMFSDPLFSNQLNTLKKELDLIVEKYPILRRPALKAFHHASTLGSGNHYVEVCKDQNNEVWVMLHTGSRGMGNAIGRCFIELAKEEMLKSSVHLPDEDLAYLPEGSEYFRDYIEAVSWAQRFASLNRAMMMHNALAALSKFVNKPFFLGELAVSCHHNYISEEVHFGENVFLTRKGAVSAQKGQLGIIPGSMGAKSFIVRGKGNEESFCSCSHGAGRLMSRTEAKNRFTIEDHIRDTAGIECRKDDGVIDETPGAYKNIDDVMESQSDLVEIVYTLNQMVCVKG